MSIYKITSRMGGYTLGIYDGADEAEAIAVMTRDAGYDSVAQAAEVLGETPAQYVSDLLCELVIDEATLGDREPTDVACADGEVYVLEAGDWVELTHLRGTEYHGIGEVLDVAPDGVALIRWGAGVDAEIEARDLTGCTLYTTRAAAVAATPLQYMRDMLVESVQ